MANEVEAATGRDEVAVLDNAPLELFKVDGQAVAVRILPMASADAWLNGPAAAVGQAEGEVRTALMGGDASAIALAKSEYSARLLDAVLEYVGQASDTDRGQVAAAITAPQCADAFARLKELTDPFEQGQLRLAAHSEVNEDMVKLLANMDGATMDRVFRLAELSPVSPGGAG